MSSNFISYHCLSPNYPVLWHVSCHKHMFQMILFSGCCDDDGYKRLSYCYCVYLISICHHPLFPINVFSDCFGDYGRISQVFLFLFWTQPCLWLVTLSSTLPSQASRSIMHLFFFLFFPLLLPFSRACVDWCSALFFFFLFLYDCTI